MKKNLVSLVLLLGALMLPAAVHAQNIYGDVNGDLEVNIADVNAVIDIILTDSGNLTAGDVNGDHEVNIADVNTIISIILSGPAPDLEHDYVDLGLPSGTLWATRNVGASAPEEYGDYFAWGETEPKNDYDWSTYKWCNGSMTKLTKYCTYSYYGYNDFVDDKTELDPADDAACAHYPGGRMPSLEQIKELIDSCTWTWSQLNGVHGALATGPNGNTMFLPLPGEYLSDRPYAGTKGYYWSRTLNLIGGSQLANRLIITDWHTVEVWAYWADTDRAWGLTVRAVLFSQN